MAQHETTRTEPIDVSRDDVLQTPHILYKLHYHEFQSLTKIPGFLAYWAHSFFAGTGVYLVTILARLAEKYIFGGTSSISKLEWITLGILVVLVLVLEGIYLCVPSEKMQMEKRIQKYFDTHEN